VSFGNSWRIGGRKCSEDFADYDAQMVSAERAAALRNTCLNLTKTCRLGSGWASERTSQSRQLMSPIGLLQKSFWGDERKFLEPLMRLTRGDVRDHIVSSKIDCEPSWRR